MRTTYKTKVGSLGGSVSTVIPAGLAQLLQIKKGDKLTWCVDITDKGVRITITPES